VAEQESKDVYFASFDKLVKRWDKCINVGGGFIENKCFFRVRISHVLRFISICDIFTDSPSYFCNKMYKMSATFGDIASRH
jgi:hypothetical protein